MPVHSTLDLPVYTAFEIAVLQKIKQWPSKYYGNINDV